MTNDDEILGQFRAMATGFGQALEGWPAAREASVRVVEEMIGSGALRP